MEDKKLKKQSKKGAVSLAHKQEDRDIQTDEDLSDKGPEDELDEGELARLEGQDDGEMNVSNKDKNK